MDTRSQAGGVSPQALQRFAPFNRLAPVLVALAGRRALRAGFADGETIIGAPAAAPYAYFLLDGQVELCDADGNIELVTCDSSRNAVALGEGLDDGVVVRARGAVTCARLARQDLALLARQDRGEARAALSPNQVLTAIQAELAGGRLRVPSLPDLAVKVREALQRADCDNRRIAALLSLDPAIAAKVLKLANSPLYRGLSPVRSLPQAIGRIGTRAVSELVVCMSLGELFACREAEFAGLFESIIAQSVHLGVYAALIAERASPALRERALVAGLLAQIGALPLLERLAAAEPRPTRSELAGHVRSLVPRLTELVCRHWQLGDDIVLAHRDAQEWKRLPSRDAPLAGILIAARFHARLELGADARLPDPGGVPALALVADPWTPQSGQALLDDARDRIAGMLELIR